MCKFHLKLNIHLDYNYCMFRRKQFVALLLMTLFAMRALIPDGYMLSDTGEKNFSTLKLTLCPSQNDYILDSHVLTGKSSRKQHVHHSTQHSPTDEINQNDAVAVSSGESCSLWAGSNPLSGTNSLPQSSAEYSQVLTGSTQSLPVLDDIYRRSAYARAPPNFSV